MAAYMKQVAIWALEQDMQNMAAAISNTRAGTAAQIELCAIFNTLEAKLRAVRAH
jgi:hypothetical protein